MTTLYELLHEEEATALPPANKAGSVTGIPIGYQTRIFLERGADSGSQRTEAVRATRNLLGAGYDIEDVADMVFAALEKSPNDPANPWLYVDALEIARDLASKPAPPPKPFESGPIILDHVPPEAEAGPVEAAEDVPGRFTFAFPEHDVVIEVSRVVSTSDGTTAWIRILVAGAEQSAVECELRTAQGVLAAWRFFGEWGAKPWRQMLEVARRKVLAARESGGVTMWMDEVAASDRAVMRVSSLIVNGHFNIVFSAGGQGKSMLMLFLCQLLQEGRSHAGLTVLPGNVLYLDWEQGASDAKATLTALAKGMGAEPANFIYMRCDSTLGEMAEHVSRLIVEQQIAVVFIDSLTFALGGDKSDQQNVMAGMSALRLWPEGVTTIANDHIPKGEKLKPGGSPIGSVFVENTARNLIRVMAWQDPETHELHQVLQQTKQNKGMLEEYGLLYRFEPESMNPTVIYVEREDPPFDVAGKLAEKPPKDQLAGAPQRLKVLEFIRTRPERFWSKTALAKELAPMSEDTVKSALAWLLEKSMIYQIKGRGNIPHTYGFVSVT